MDEYVESSLSAPAFDALNTCADSGASGLRTSSLNFSKCQYQQTDEPRF